MWYIIVLILNFPSVLPLYGLASPASCSWFVGSSKFWSTLISSCNFFSCPCSVTFCVSTFHHINIKCCMFKFLFVQYRPMVPTQQGQHFISSVSQQFQPQPVGQGQPLQYSQQMQPYPLRPSQPGHAQPSSQALPMPYYQPRPVNSVPSHSQQPAPPFNNQMPGMPYPSSYMVWPH